MMLAIGSQGIRSH